MPDESALSPKKIKVVECFVGYYAQQFCKPCASGGKDKKRNKGQDIVSVNEANFKGSSEASLKCFTEPHCFSNHTKSSLTKKNVNNCKNAFK